MMVTMMVMIHDGDDDGDDILTCGDADYNSSHKHFTIQQASLTPDERAVI